MLLVVTSLHISTISTYYIYIFVTIIVVFVLPHVVITVCIVHMRDCMCYFLLIVTLGTVALS